MSKRIGRREREALIRRCIEEVTDPVAHTWTAAAAEGRLAERLRDDYGYPEAEATRLAHTWYAEDEAKHILGAGWDTDELNDGTPPQHLSGSSTPGASSRTRAVRRDTHEERKRGRIVARADRKALKALTAQGLPAEEIDEDTRYHAAINLLSDDDYTAVFGHRRDDPAVAEVARHALEGAVMEAVWNWGVREIEREEGTTGLPRFREMSRPDATDAANPLFQELLATARRDVAERMAADLHWEREATEERLWTVFERLVETFQSLARKGRTDAAE